MTLITRNNYEAFMLDYIEENLSPELTAEFMLFLDDNPELKGELEGFEIHRLEPIAIGLMDKSSLKKEDIPFVIGEFEDLAIGEIEGENAPENTVELNSFLRENPKYQSDFNVYQKTKLQASNIIFDAKKALKKKERRVIPIYWWYSSAAAVLIMFFLFNIFKRDNIKKLPIVEEQREVMIPLKKDVSGETRVQENEMAHLKDKPSSFSQKPQIKIKQTTVQQAPVEIVLEEKRVNDKVLSIDSEKQQEIIKDTIFHDVIEELPKEVIQYANNVKITYDDEPKFKVVKKKSRIWAVGQFITKPLKKRILTQDKDENGEVIAYAINLAGFKLSRNKRKKSH